MDYLREPELQRFNQAVLDVHATRSAGDFSANLLQALRHIVSADILVVDWSDPVDDMALHTLYTPLGAVPREINEAVHRHLGDNPAYGTRRKPASISDHLTPSQWKKSALYGEAYGRLGQQDGLGLDIDLGRGHRLTLNASRSHPGFGNGERTGLKLLEMHVRHVHARMRMQQNNLRSLQEAGTNAGLSLLTPREREVLQWVAEGQRNREIAERLNISPGTVKRHLENIYTKLDLDNRHQLSGLSRLLPPA